MKSILARIGAIIRAMSSKAWTWVQEGGRWVMRLVPSTAAQAAEPIIADEPASAPDADIVAVKAVAAAMAAGIDPTPDQLKGMSDKQLRWLKAMDNRMLCIVAVAEPAQIRAHMRQQASIKGMVPYDDAAIADVIAARAAPVPGKRTLREELEAQGLVL